MSALAISLPLDFEQPMWLLLCALIPVLIVASIRSLAGLDPVRRVLAIVVRSAVILLVALCLARVQRVQRNNDLTVLFLMDRSHSVQALQDEQEAFIRAASADLPPKDRVGLIDFAREPALQQLPMRGGYFIQPGRLPVMPNTDRTNVAAALRLAMAMFPHDTAKRVVLMSDGNDNMGDVLSEARRARADGIPIDVVPLRYQHRNEVYFDRMIAPAHAEPGEQVPILRITQKPVAGFRQPDSVVRHLGVGLGGEFRQRLGVKLRPGARQQVIADDVHQNGCQAPEFWRETLAAETDVSMPIAVGIDPSVEAHAPGQLPRHVFRYPALYEVAQEAAGDQPRIVAGTCTGADQNIIYSVSVDVPCT